jgi:hypothetical protein
VLPGLWQAFPGDIAKAARSKLAPEGKGQTHSM